MLSDLPRRLAARLKQPLPGRRARARFQPELSFGRHLGPPPSSARPAAVLMLLYPYKGRWHLPLTVRPLHLPTHAGQISLPGGMVEPGESSGEAALRELDEELGVRKGVELLGKLSPFYVYVSNCRVTPWVGAIGERPQWKPNPREVAEVLEVPLEHLLDPVNYRNFLVEYPRVVFRAPCFDWRGHPIWGATGMMLGELVEVMREL